MKKINLTMELTSFLIHGSTIQGEKNWKRDNCAALGVNIEIKLGKVIGGKHLIRSQ